MENKRHLNQVESLRAIAALSVTFYHFSSYFIWSEGAANTFEVGAQGVEIFYLISGFIITYSLYHSGYAIKNYFQYLGKRLSRLLPPYFLTITLIHLVGFLICFYVWEYMYDINFRQTAINVFFLADLFPKYDWLNPIFSTLKVELQFYLLIGFLFPLIKNYRWMFPVLSVLLLFSGFISRDYDTVLVNSPYFICGMSLFFIKEEGWKPYYILTLIASLSSLVLFYYWEDLGAAIVGFGLLLVLPSTFRPLNITGRISYSLYLTHGLAGGWFLFFTSESTFAINNPWLMIGAAIAISWLVAYGIYWLIEKPSITFSKKIKYKK